MDELIVLPEDKELVARLHSGGEEPPLPFEEEDIFLLGIQVAGPMYNANIEELYDGLRVGDRVRLVREPENPYDEYAIRIDVIEDENAKASAGDGKLAVDGGVKLGYFPRSHNRPFARLMDAGKYLYGVVRRKEIVGEYPEIVVKVYMKDDVYRSSAVPASVALKQAEPTTKKEPYPVVSGSEADYVLEPAREGGYIIKKFRGIDKGYMEIPNTINGKRIVGIGEEAFKSCLNLEKLVVSPGIEFIEDGAFFHCIQLEQIVLPESLIRIGNSTPLNETDRRIFRIRSEERETASGRKGAFEMTAISKLTLPNSLCELGVFAFSYCEKLTDIKIPDGVTIIADFCFENCRKLESIDLSKRLKSIGYGAFRYCNSLKRVILPPEVKTLEEDAFFGCNELSFVNLNEGLQTIGDSVFFGCKKMNSITIPRSVIKIGRNAFRFDSSLEPHNPVIRCYPGTAGLDYARENGLRVVSAE